MNLVFARIFCKNTTIRGVGKILTAPSPYLRTLWSIYVLSMVGLLISASVQLFKDYLDYSTVIQTTWGESGKSEFPSLTFCNHYPFSQNGKELWRKGLVMSPKQWNNLLRKRLKECLDERDVICALDNFLYDSKRMYYQNLKHRDAVKIGHNLDNSILLCVALRGASLTVGTPNECGIIVESISLVDYFNCFTVRPLFPSVTDKLILVLNVRDKPDFEHYEQAFIKDIFEQAHGVRVAVHEPRAFPNMEAQGEQVEAGKMVELSYLPIRVHEVNTPKEPCYEDPADYPPIEDLGKSYNYSSEACVSLRKNEHYKDTCGCYFADHLRPGIPDATTPYCGEILNTTDEQFAVRRRCVFQEMKKMANHGPGHHKCYRRCTHYRYRTRTSITKWRPTHWQVYWARSQLRALNHLYEAKYSRLEEDPKAVESVTEYVNSDNLTDIKSNQTRSIPTDADDYVYVVLSRQDFRDMLEINKLTLTLNGLISRVGGLCSLCLGLTCAFAIELVEYFYLLKQNYSQPKQKEINKNGNPTVNMLQRPFIAIDNNNSSSNFGELTLARKDHLKRVMAASVYNNINNDYNDRHSPRIPRFN